MANNRRKVISTATGMTNATYNGTAVGFEANDDDFLFELVADKTAGAGNFDAKVQHSFDKTNWFDLATAFTTLTDDGTQLLVPTSGTKVLQWVRSVITVAAGATYTATVTAYYRKRS